MYHRQTEIPPEPQGKACFAAALAANNDDPAHDTARTRAWAVARPIAVDGAQHLVADDGTETPSYQRCVSAPPPLDRTGPAHVFFTAGTGIPGIFTLKDPIMVRLVKNSVFQSSPPKAILVVAGWPWTMRPSFSLFEC